MLRVSAPRIHCGWTKKQTLASLAEKSLLSESGASDASAAGRESGGKKEQQQQQQQQQQQCVAKYYLLPFAPSGDAGKQKKAEKGEKGEKGGGGGEKEVVRMENAVLVDRTRRGGNDPNTADELDRVLIVLCDGHGSTSMLGAKHPLEMHVGGAEMARLACNSLLGDLQTRTQDYEKKDERRTNKELEKGENVEAQLVAAFKDCESRLQRALHDGVSRNATLGESLLDGAYFAALSAASLRPILPSTVVSKTSEIVDDVPLVRYICSSGHKIDLTCGVCATVLDCTPKSVCCANVGGVLAALFSPVKRLPGEPSGGGGGSKNAYTCEWLTESHTVNGAKERSRLQNQYGISAAGGSSSGSNSCFKYKTSPMGAEETKLSDDAKAESEELSDANRYSRALGRQLALRKQGMLAAPSVSSVALETGQWIVVGSSGFWQSMSGGDGEDVAARKIAILLADSKQKQSHGNGANDPNRFADLLVETAMKGKEERKDNMTLIVINKT